MRGDLSRLLRNSTLDHVAIATPTGAHPVARLSGWPARGARTMPSGVAIDRFGPLEIVFPAAPGTPIDHFLSRRGEGLHHVALASETDLDLLLPRLRTLGIETAGGIESGSDGRRTLFLHPRTMGGVLVELVEDRG